MSATPHLNRAKCKAFMLAYAERSRAHKFSRVSAEALETVEFTLRAAMRDIVDSQPSKGKTIK